LACQFFNRRALFGVPGSQGLDLHSHCGNQIIPKLNRCAQSLRFDSFVVKKKHHGLAGLLGFGELGLHLSLGVLRLLHRKVRQPASKSDWQASTST